MLLSDQRAHAREAAGRGGWRTEADNGDNYHLGRQRYGPRGYSQVLDNLHRHDIESSFSLVGNKLRDRRYEVATPTIDAVLALVQERGPQAGLSGNDAPKMRPEVSVLPIRPLLAERTGHRHASLPPSSSSQPRCAKSPTPFFNSLLDHISA